MNDGDDIDRLRVMLDDLDDSSVPEQHLDFIDDMLEASYDWAWNPTPNQIAYIRDLHRDYT
jgi:hypothetical protein